MVVHQLGGAHPLVALAKYSCHLQKFHARSRCASGSYVCLYEAAQETFEYSQNTSHLCEDHGKHHAYESPALNLQERRVVNRFSGVLQYLQEK